MLLAMCLGLTPPPPHATFTRGAIIRTAATATAALLPLHAVATGNAPPAVKGASSLEAMNLAKHLKEKGAKMYGAYWCSNCVEQKDEFGAGAARLLSYVECAEDGYNSERPSCRAKQVPGYPTWEIDGELFVGRKTLEELAVLSGCCDFRPGFCAGTTPEEVASAAKEVFRR